MTRAELIAELAASNPHLRQEDAELIVATIFDQITAALARGERVELRGFGAFTVKQRSGRIRPDGSTSAWPPGSNDGSCRDWGDIRTGRPRAI